MLCCFDRGTFRRGFGRVAQSAMRPANLVGKVYGHVTVKRRAGRAKDGHAKWRCVCSCGEQFDAIANDLARGRHKACNINGHRWTGWIEERGLKRHCVE